LTKEVQVLYSRIIIVIKTAVPHYKKSLMMAFRMTPQREVILQEVEKADSHPTADQIYARVRKRLPRISLGTVYRNLEVLSQRGMIRKVEVGGSQRRFDWKTDNHYHARCLSCGRVDDLPIEPEMSLEKVIGSLVDYQITGHLLEFVGLCFDCRKRPERQEHKGAETRALKKK
jgi:Fur family ferric uptake transcriptional regulator